MKLLLLAFLMACAGAWAVINPRAAQDPFDIKIVRRSFTTPDNLVRGELYVNGQLLGGTYERLDLRIKKGTYPGFLRYVSRRGHVQGPFGEVGDKGDFLLEIGNVAWSNGVKRSNLLFHGGNRAEHSQGCVMLGPVSVDASGNRVLPEGHTLRKLRLAFYGTETPVATPNRNITIEITETW